MAEIETPSAPQEPPVYTWHPHDGAQPWLPAPATTRADPERHSPTAPKRGREGGILGAIAAGGAAFLKYGLILLKLGKLGPTLISMVIAFFFYAVFFGPIFGVGLVLLILVHELGHVAVSRYEGLPMTAPVFLGPFGAVTGMKRPPKDARQEAVIALGGPVVGIAASIALFAWAETSHAGYWQSLLFALAYFGFFLNLFNLIPMSPLDGGRIATAVSLWLNVLGLVIMAAVVLFLGNPFALIIFILGLITTIQRFRNARRGLEPAPVPARTRFIIGVVWLATLATAAGGMSLAHSAQINSNTVPGVTQQSGSA